MKIRRRPPCLHGAFLALLLAAAPGIAAAAAPDLHNPDPAFAVPDGIRHLSRTAQPYAVAPLDKITIRKADGSAAELQVTQEGLLPLDGDGTGIPARGLTVEALGKAVSRALKGASVTWVEEFRPARVTVLGEVFHQIHTEMPDGPMRVLDAIAARFDQTSS